MSSRQFYRRNVVWSLNGGNLSRLTQSFLFLSLSPPSLPLSPSLPVYFYFTFPEVHIFFLPKVIDQRFCGFCTCAWNKKSLVTKHSFAKKLVSLTIWKQNNKNMFLTICQFDWRDCRKNFFIQHKIICEFYTFPRKLIKRNVCIKGSHSSTYCLICGHSNIISLFILNRLSFITLQTTFRKSLSPSLSLTGATREKRKTLS